jgi:hypothetical protein
MCGSADSRRRCPPADAPARRRRARSPVCRSARPTPLVGAALARRCCRRARPTPPRPLAGVAARSRAPISGSRSPARPVPGLVLRRRPWSCARRRPHATTGPVRHRRIASSPVCSPPSLPPGLDLRFRQPPPTVAVVRRSPHTGCTSQVQPPISTVRIFDCSQDMIPLSSPSGADQPGKCCSVNCNFLILVYPTPEIVPVAAAGVTQRRRDLVLPPS